MGAGDSSNSLAPREHQKTPVNGFEKRFNGKMVALKDEGLPVVPLRCVSTNRAGWRDLRTEFVFPEEFGHNEIADNDGDCAA